MDAKDYAEVAGIGPEIKRTPEEEAVARELCFADCSSGVHLDFEAGCVSVCGGPEECQGWVPYLSDARQQGSPETDGQ